MGRKIPITPEQEALPISKYYHREPAPIPAEKLALLAKGPCDPGCALDIHHRNDLFLSGYLPVETGYCVLEDGTGFVANHTAMPGVTAEMFDWWFAWHGCGPLRYTIWDPEDHTGAVSLNYGQARCAALSMKERYWGTTHIIREDIGMGADELFASFREPRELGYEQDKIGTDACSTIVCANSGTTRSAQMSVVMTNFLRSVPGGSELRTRFWMGWHIISGKARRMLPEGAALPIEVPRALVYHNAKEFTNLAAILPQVYAEERDRF